MKLLVSGSSGHLGEALVRRLRADGHAVLGVDILPGDSTDVVASITDRERMRDCLRGVDAVLHTATLHKPHVATHSPQAFIDINISGTLTLLEGAVEAGVGAFVFTSTTSTFGDALVPPPDQPAAWITESVGLQPKNIYGVTKAAAEDLCQLFQRNAGLPCLILRTSRFFPEADDNPDRRQAFDDLNLKTIELLYRRVDLHDVVSAHQAALANARRIGFGKYIISATTPFRPQDLPLLRGQADVVLRGLLPEYEPVFRQRGWRMLPDIERVYVNERARTELGWRPEYDFARAIDDLAQGRDPRSPLARSIPSKGYHPGRFEDGLYPVQP
ncbi:MAG: NAD(P)-dependent oxidoreductase [Lysobacterales bacterium]